MKDAALARGHGCEGEGLAGVADALDSGFGCHAELLVAKHFKVVGVEGDAVVLFVLEAEDLRGDVLDGEKEFSVACEKQGDVAAGELD